MHFGAEVFMAFLSLSLGLVATREGFGALQSGDFGSGG